MNNKRNWTLETTDDGEKIFVDTVTGEFVKGYDVHLTLREGSKVKIISPEKQQKFKDRQQKYLKRINQQKILCSLYKIARRILVKSSSRTCKSVS